MAILRKLKKRLLATQAEQEFISWEDYQDKVDFLDMLVWQQATRRQSLANLNSL